MAVDPGCPIHDSNVPTTATREATQLRAVIRSTDQMLEALHDGAHLGIYPYQKLKAELDKAKEVK